MSAIRLPTSADAFENLFMAPFIDPLTECPYVDPVTDPHGHTFSNDFIVQWLSQNNTCPYTSTPLSVNELVKNRALAHSQEAFFNEENGSVIRLQRQLSVLSLENERLTQENTGLRLENRELKIENQDLKNDMKSLMATLSHTNANMVKALEDNAFLKEHNTKIREDNEVLRNLNKKLEEDNQEIKEGQKILNKKIEDLTSKEPSKECDKIVSVSDKVIKQDNEKLSKEQQKECEPKKSSPGSGCVAQNVKLFVRPIIWVAKAIF